MTPSETAVEHIGNAQQLLVDVRRALAEARGSKDQWVRECVGLAQERVEQADLRLARARVALGAPGVDQSYPLLEDDRDGWSPA
jgi:phage shock protein A